MKIDCIELCFEIPKFWNSNDTEIPKLKFAGYLCKIIIST